MLPPGGPWLERLRSPLADALGSGGSGLYPLRFSLVDVAGVSADVAEAKVDIEATTVAYEEDERFAGEPGRVEVLQGRRCVWAPDCRGGAGGPPATDGRARPSVA